VQKDEELWELEVDKGGALGTANPGDPAGQEIGGQNHHNQYK
jgi:hypothetical protein